MYTKFYGFSHKPFELTPNPDVIFLSETHQEALSVLLYGVNNRKGFLQVSGDVGSGKSTLVQALIKKLPENIHLCHIPNPNFKVDEFYYFLSAKFGLAEFDGNKAKFILNLAEFIKQCSEKNEFALLIIDEAQVLSLELLEEIRLLSNQEYSEFGVLSIFFVGQPELNILLKHSKMAPLRNRIGIRFNLDPLTFDETTAYIQFRLKKAGRTAGLFSQKAFKEIHEASGGIPRYINILCDNALLSGFVEQQNIIDENIIIDCVKELEQPDIINISPDNFESASLKHETTYLDSSPRITVPPAPLPTKPVPPGSAPSNPESPGQKAVENDNRKSTPIPLYKKAALVFVIICSLFIILMYTKEYWGKFPEAKPAVVLFERGKERFNALKNDIGLYLTEKNATPEKSISSSEHQVENNITDKTPKVISESIAEPVNTGPNSEKLDITSNTDQIPPEPTATSLTTVDAAAEQIEIKQNPDGTNSIIITRQARFDPTPKVFSKNNGIIEPAITGQNQGEKIYGSITSQVGGANIRSAPSLTANSVHKVPPGYPIRVLGEQGDWTFVEDFKNTKGWIFTQLIVENVTVILKSDKVKLRHSPSHLSDIVAQVDYGTIMHVEEKKGNWLRINNSNEVVGWIHEDKVWP